MNWFQHDTDATQDAKIKKLIIRHGAVGYAVYFHCLELIAADISESNLTCELEHDSEIIADNLHIKETSDKSGREVVEAIMVDIISLGLFTETEGRIFCIKLLKRVSLSMTSSPSFRLAIAKKKEQYHDTVMTRHDLVTTGHETLHYTTLQGLHDKEEREEPVFSKAKALNPNTQNQEQRFQQIKTAWNANCKPTCNIRSTLTMSYTQRDEWLAGESQIVDIFATCKAMQNYGGILGNPEYEIDGHKGYSMLSFLIKGVGWYTDEAKPFERCKKKQAAKPDKASSVEVPDAERTREYLDSLRAEGVEEAGVFEFDAAKAMEEIRARGAG